MVVPVNPVPCRMAYLVLAQPGEESQGEVQVHVSALLLGGFQEQFALFRGAGRDRALGDHQPLYLREGVFAFVDLKMGAGIVPGASKGQEVVDRLGPLAGVFPSDLELLDLLACDGAHCAGVELCEKLSPGVLFH